MLHVQEIGPRKGKPQWQKVYLSDGSVIELPKTVILQQQLWVGKQIGTEDLETLHHLSEYHRAQEAALHYVGYKARTEYQVRQHLSKKGFKTPVIDQVIAFLHRYCYLNDAEFAREFIRSYLKRKPSGYYRVRYELRRRGIAEHLIEAALAPFEDDIHQHHLAREAALRKLRALQHKPAAKQRQLLIQFLQRRGFTWDTIRLIIEELFDDLQ